MKFKDLLKTLREQKGLTQEYLAEKLKVSKGAVSQWETGRTMPTLYKLQEISKILDHNFIEDEEIYSPRQDYVTHDPNLILILEKMEQMRKENRDIYDKYMILVEENLNYKVMVNRLKKALKESNLPTDELERIMEIINDD